MLIVIYEHVYFMSPCKFGADSCAKHINSSPKNKERFFVMLKLVRPKVKMIVSKIGNI